MLQSVRYRLCGGEAARRADAALAISASQRIVRRNAIETSRSSSSLMNEALRELHDALRSKQ